MISITKNFTIEDIQPAIQKSLQQSIMLVEGRAKENAPVLSGALKGSIHGKIEPNRGIISTGSEIAYGRVREYNNNKNPGKKFYMKRAIDNSEEQIKKYFEKNILKAIIKNK